MKIIGYTLLFAVIGLIAGYLLYAHIDGSFLDPRHILAPPDASEADSTSMAFELEKIRARIFSAGLIGALAGLVFGFVSGGGKKKPSFF